MIDILQSINENLISGFDYSFKKKSHLLKREHMKKGVGWSYRLADLLGEVW